MDKLTVFIALTGIAVLLQAGVLLAMYITMRKSSRRMEALATEVKSKVLPAIDQAQQMLIQVRPSVESIVGKVSGAWDQATPGPLRSVLQLTTEASTSNVARAAFSQVNALACSTAALLSAGWRSRIIASCS